MKLIRVFLFTFAVALAGNTDCLDKLIANAKNAVDGVITSTAPNLSAKCKALKIALALLETKVEQYNFCKNVYVHAFTDAYGTIDSCKDTYEKYCKTDISTTTEYVTETTTTESPTTEAECILECSSTTPEDTTTESSTTESSTTESSTTDSSTRESSTTESSTPDSSTIESSTTESSTTESSTTETSTPDSSTTESSSTESFSTESSTVPITSTPPESSTTEITSTASYLNENDSDESSEQKNKHKLKMYKSSYAIHFILEFFGGVKHNDKNSKKNKTNLTEEI